MILQYQRKEERLNQVCYYFLAKENLEIKKLEGAKI
ncbi:MAG: hypothetical protein K0S93_179 [Nitrososphaeraceae archaeon]|jgi:hypothetical protein|nr:hypothetical protein [Nitrososphaeraceae archaeon]